MIAPRSEISARTSVPPADVRVATSSAVSPKAAAEVATSNLIPTLTGVASAPSAALGLSRPVPQVGLGAADLSSPTVSATRSVDDLGSVQDALKMSTDGQPAAGLGAAASERPLPLKGGVTAGETAESSRDLPAASSGVAGLSPVRLADRSNCIGDIDPVLEAEITALEVSWLRCGIVMNSMALRVAVASEIQPSVSTTSIPTT